MAESRTTELTPEQQLRAAYEDVAARHERAALEVHTHPDVGAIALAAKLAGRLEGLRTAAELFKVELPEADHLP